METRKRLAALLLCAVMIIPYPVFAASEIPEEPAESDVTSVTEEAAAEEEQAVTEEAVIEEETASEETAAPEDAEGTEEEIVAEPEESEPAEAMLAEEGDEWTAADFIFDGATVTGLSDSGKEKIKINPDLVIPDKNGDTEITAIGASAFLGTAITSVKFPAGITSIGQIAFRACNSLKEVVIPDTVISMGMGVFTSCTALESVTLGAGLTEIPQAAFNTCDLREVQLPSGIKSVGNNAFTGNFKLTKITLNDGLESIGSSAFGNAQITELTIPASVKTIGNYAFRVNNATLSNTLATLKLNEGLESIGNASFGRSALTEVTLPSSVKTLNKGAFTGSTEVVKVYTDNFALLASDNESGKLDIILPARTITFDANGGTTETTTAKTNDNAKLDELPAATKPAYAFDGWYTAAEGGDKITSDTAFEKDTTIYAQYVVSPWNAEDFTYSADGATVTGLTDSGKAKVALDPDMVIPDKNGDTEITGIGASAFAATAITSVQFPAGLTSLGQTAFRACNSLKEVVIPDTVTSMGQGVFTTCTALESITFSKGLNEVPQATCNGCNNLATINMHDGIKSIGANAFARDYALTELKLPAELETIGNSAFSYNKLSVVELPAKVKSVGNSAFSNQASGGGSWGTLKTVTLNEGLETIGTSAFNYASVKEVQLPSTVKTLPRNAFGTTTTNQIGKTLIIPVEGAEYPATVVKNTPADNNGHVFQFTITFDAGEGSEDPATGVTGTDGKLTEAMPEASRPAYKFDGWFTAAEDGDEVTEDTVFADDTTVYAHYTQSPWNAEDFTYSEDGATVTGLTDSGKAKVALDPDMVIPDKNGDTEITGIGASAFAAAAITSVQFPAGLKSIEQMAFRACSSLKEVAIPDTVTSMGQGVFTTCTALESITFSKGLNEVPQATCNGCNNLATINMHDGIKSIGANAFARDYALTELKLPADLETIGNSAFSYNKLSVVELPAKVKSVGNSAFNNQASGGGSWGTLKTVTLNEGLETIGTSAFNYASVKEVQLPSTVKTLPRNAFGTTTTNQIGKTLIIPAEGAEYPAGVVKNTPSDNNGHVFQFTVTFDAGEGSVDPATGVTGTDGKLTEAMPEASRPAYSFDGWFTTAEDGDEVAADAVFAEDTTVYAHYTQLPWGEEDFTYDDKDAGTVTGLTESGKAKVALDPNMIIPDKNGDTEITAIGNNAFANAEIESVVYPANLKSIGISAFRNTKIKEAVIPDTVTSIGGGAYASNYELGKIVLPKGITEIANGTFNRQILRGDHYDDYPSVGEIVIPDGVTSIGMTAFHGLGITKVNLPEGLTTIGQSAFANNKLAGVNIPGSVKTIPRQAFAVGMAMYNDPVKLTSLTLNEGTETISTNAFENNDLHELQLPTTIKAIDDTAFRKGMSSTPTADEWVLVYGTAEQRADKTVNTGTGYGHKFSYVVTFDAGAGTVDPTEGNTDADGKLTIELPAPTHKNAVFDGWYAEGAETAATADDAYTEDTTLTAKWIDKTAAPKISTVGTASKKQMKVSWNAVSGAESYVVAYRKAGETGWTTKTAKSTTYNVTGLANKALYEFRVAGVSTINGSKEQGAWSNVSRRYFSKGVFKKVKAGKKKVTLTWKKDSSADGYEIRYGYKKNMSDAKTIKISKNSTTKYTIKKLQKGKKVYVRIRPIKNYEGKRYAGILSTQKAVKVK